MRKSVFLFLLWLLPFAAPAQQSWWVYFTDKNGSTFDPETYFAPEALQRRAAQGLPICDSTDFPVAAAYINAVAQIADSTGYSSRWLNAIGITASEEQANRLRRLPFVRSVEPQNTWNWLPASQPDTLSEWPFEGKAMPDDHLRPLQAKLFADSGCKAKGIVIAVLDVGFRGTDKHDAFRKLYFNNRVRATFDFVDNDWNVYENREDHGTMVLSCLAGYFNDQPLGMATEATYLLARISRNYGNQYKGEERWVAALEWADQQGANIINSSGGPNEESYFREQIDGKTSVITRASNLAARKGILVVAAAGNNGEFEKGFLLPPSDADSALSVGAVGRNGLHESYSASGPTWDFRRKPDLCAPGEAPVANGRGKYTLADGTSFACPIVAGMAACLMQRYPSITVTGVADSLRRSCNRYPYYDYMHGYGIPQAGYFFGKAPQPKAPCLDFVKAGDSLLVQLKPDFVPAFGATAPTMFYSLEDARGIIYEYHVIQPRSASPVILTAEQRAAGGRIHVYYEGYYASYAF
ncbi:MAG: S8 family serine peptidase [Bacteroidota bacterium]